ncbi:uncharacterized protein BP01DRAFT_363542 [Aspergillus saccharolyticus JOP 1030-1]|uniref:Uncharacterized protein n=1 Tax=Aspergillus saccharolyticus JOP 1030-1 TaxID=1450539 RepID=A0A318ZJM1_9EURO|nr:hypothetical protein BP01DRAFT_363542 [Aspergillus saccharolyticus JOP 1030-1]PYH47729.1 hypothetical protein BP01DRAFT_363542 [Aspergillus saccharolyticus JOP 1030-1]
MAEPDDVEEDLFADLYDADDTTVQTKPIVEPPQMPEPITPAPHASATELRTQYADHGHGDIDAGGSYQYSHQSGNHAGGENGGAGFAHPAAASVGESEPQGTGIKEDGGHGHAEALFPFISFLILSPIVKRVCIMAWLFPFVSAHYISSSAQGILENYAALPQQPQS